MQIYNYSSTTGEYLGVSAADPDPRNQGEYLMPAFSTVTTPPEIKDHEAAVFVDGAWQTVPDYRGTTWWRPDGTSYTITDIGISPFKNHTSTEPPAATAARVQAALVKDALAALAENDMVFIRCGKAGIPYPEAWSTRDEALREIVRGDSQSTEIPGYPRTSAGAIAYPEGT